jgi:predicted Zn-dependent peptidase
VSGRRFPQDRVPLPPEPPPYRWCRLGNGLTVVAARRPVVPLVEIRVRVGLDDVDPAQVAVLAATLLGGTAGRSAAGIEARLCAVGARFEVTTDRDRLELRGRCLAAGLGTALDVLADVLTGASFPADVVPGPRSALADQAAALAHAPEHAALVALSELIYGDHPYADPAPGPERVRAVTAEQLRDLRACQLRPDATTVAVVGDVDPEQICDVVEVLLGGWALPAGTHRAPPVPPVPTPWPAAGRTVLAHRAGSPQATVRTALPAVGRGHPDHPALRLANLVFGGYFSSRLVANLRVDKGYAYAPASLPHEMRAGALTVVLADVQPEAAGGTVREIRRELDGLADRPISAAELGRARRYAMGSDLLALADTAGLADTAVRLAAVGFGLDEVAEHGRRLADLTVEELAGAAERYFAAGDAVTVVLGDGPSVLPGLAEFLAAAPAGA